jgi:hypothetical protein
LNWIPRFATGGEQFDRYRIADEYEKYPMLMTHGHRLTSTSAAAWRGFMLAI